MYSELELELETLARQKKGVTSCNGFVGREKLLVAEKVAHKCRGKSKKERKPKSIGLGC